MPPSGSTGAAVDSADGSTPRPQAAGDTLAPVAGQKRPSPSPAPEDGSKPAQPSDRKFLKRIAKTKVRARSELDPSVGWSSRRYQHRSLWHRIIDTVPRVDVEDLSVRDFVAQYEVPSKPVVLTGVTKDWSANANWQPEVFYNKYKKYKFKVGEDDDGNTVYLRYKHFARYCNSVGLEDDSPLYIFDSSFADRKVGKNGDLPRPMRPILDDYEVPKYFSDDLFDMISYSRRPPHRWIVIGPDRSGTGIHLDPLGTSAWNTLVVGYKRWCLFPPHISKQVVSPRKNSVYYDPRDMRYGIKRVAHTVHDYEAATWFNEVYPNLAPYRDQLEMVEIVQKPGETVYVPGGWHHVVINLSLTVAITQNYCSVANFDQVYLQARAGRPKMTLRWRATIEAKARELGIDLDALRDAPALAIPLPGEPGYEVDKFAYLVQMMMCLDATPRVPRSSSSDSDSSSSSSSGSGSDSDNAGDRSRCRSKRVKDDGSDSG
ncbi:hypothetical protein AMAG_09354 [Allomyces macrogynus ATCC 38327]|uniref:JmjC domain-containing protein n=1 Tax=Allomyces macrogynus (strain ATCC 38327) TaxID=578462 RepID=A0A0L0SP96_ALLM3|nr:hypothetical protein AMAG_09354 [Allomyces macrogynus ATCC 38327]|eukprot:KNE64328.1 hypothetical protein AMAG_09354 [Allomyces macrogynus ATCC 38327]